MRKQKPRRAERIPFHRNWNRAEKFANRQNALGYRARVCQYNDGMGIYVEVTQ